jgi:hypothetical protein
MNDDSISNLLRHWSSTVEKSSNGTTSSSSGSTEGLSASQERISSPEPSRKKRRFSHESLNDLLFWGVQLLVVAISIAIIYSKLEATAQILRALLSEQDSELQIAKAQAGKADALAEEARQAAREAAQQRLKAFERAEQRMEDLVGRVSQIQADVKDALKKSTETNDLVLEAAKASKLAAGSAETQAIKAAGTAGAAASAASRAAALSSHTSSVVATKVVTSQDKRSLNAQQAALAAKQQKLSQTIKRVKLKGPTVFEKLLHP